MTFPRQLYQIWFQGTSHSSFQKRKDLSQNHQIWKQMNPAWTCHILDRHDLLQACRLYSKEAESCFLWMETQHMILAIDFGRYCYLWVHGGIYMDFDMWCIRPMEFSSFFQSYLHQADSQSEWLGLSALSYTPFWQSSFSSSLPHGSIYVSNGMMMSTPRHSFLTCLLHHIIQYTKERMVKEMNRKKHIKITTQESIHMISPSVVLSWTGAQMITSCYEKWDIPLLQKERIVTVFPFFLFEPCLPKTCQLHPESIAYHRGEQSWMRNRYSSFAHWCFSWISLFLHFRWSVLIIILIGILIGYGCFRIFFYNRYNRYNRCDDDRKQKKKSKNKK